MTTPAYEIAQWLHSQLVGVFAGQSEDMWSLNVSQEPAQPSSSITVYDQGGPGADTDEMDNFKHVVLVRVRGLNYLEVYAKHIEIRDLFIANTPLQTANKYFVGVDLTGNISSIGRDDNDRHVLVATYEAHEQLS